MVKRLGHKLNQQDVKNTFLFDAHIEKSSRKIRMKPVRSVKKVEMMHLIEEQKALLKET